MKLQNLSKEIEKIDRKEQYDLESDKSETDETDKIEISDAMIRIDSKTKLVIMIQLILILIERQMKKNQRKNIREKKAKKTIQIQINQKLMKDIREK